MITEKKQRKTVEWERLEISSRKLEIPRKHSKSWKMMLSKCCTQYASKFGKLSSGHRTRKGQFSFQSQRKAMPKNAQTTAQLRYVEDGADRISLLAWLFFVRRKKKKKNVKDSSEVFTWNLERWNDRELMWEDHGLRGLGKEDPGRVLDTLGGRRSLNMQRELLYRLWAIRRQSLGEKSELGCVSWKLLVCK